MIANPQSIPRPLVRANQWTIFLSVVCSWLTGQVWLLIIPLVANMLGILFGFNPIMLIGKLFLKKGKKYIPEDVAQQKFNSRIAVFCLTGGLISFLASWTVAGYAFTALVAIASFIAILGFCIGCFIQFQLKRYRYYKTQEKFKENFFK